MKDALLMLYVKTDCALKRMADRFHNDRHGAGVAEYAMVVGVAVIIGFVILKAFWGQDPNSGLRGIFTNIMSRLSSAVTGSQATGAVN